MDLEIGTVERATNLSCKVRFIGTGMLSDVRYSKTLQSNCILIQPRHVVVVDKGRTPAEVVWRAGTMATIVQLNGTDVTYYVGAAGGSRPAVTVPLVDGRPAADQATPLHEGQQVLLGPSQVRGTPAVLDTTIDGRPVHLDRLRALFPKIEAAQANTQVP